MPALRSLGSLTLLLAAIVAPAACGPAGPKPARPDGRKATAI